MKENRKKFSTVREIFETYFPSYEKRRRESSYENYGQIGVDLATELAKTFQVNLRSAVARRGDAQR